MPANPEYLGVLAQVVACIRQALDDARLPDLTPQEVTDWLHSMSVEEVRAVWQGTDRAA
jgi:hypothetical protein